MDLAKISFDIDTTNADAELGVEIWFNDSCVFTTNHLKEIFHFSHEISDDDGENELKIVMFGKNSSHTEIDEQGNIIKDAMLTVSAIQIDEVPIDQLFMDKAVYTHDFNGTQPEISDVFFQHIGCNGTVSLKFTTPVYLWLLENM